MTVNLSFIGGAGWQFFDDNGDPLSGGKIYTYAAGTTTPLETYTARDGTTPNTNPIILDAAGRTPQQVWATEGLLYKYVVKTAADVLVRTWDNIGNSYVASNLELDLASTLDNAKGDALIGFRQSNAAGFLPGATGRTVNAKLQEIVSVKDFGAVGDGVTDDAAAFQAAVDAFKPAVLALPTVSKVIYVPVGTYIIDTPVQLWSGISLVGDGVGSILKAGPSGPPRILELAGGAAGQYKQASIENLCFEATGATWAIQATVGLNLNNNFFNLVFRCNFGVEVADVTYTQACHFNNLYSSGTLDQLLRLRGNFNLIENLDKESSTGTSTDPYVLLYGAADGTLCNGNILRKILLEGAGSVNKVPLKFLNAWGNSIQAYWLETTATNGYGMELDNSRITMLGVTAPFRGNTTKGKLSNYSFLTIEELNVNSQDIPWVDYFEVDSTSVLTVSRMLTRRNADLIPIDTPNLSASRALASVQFSGSGVVAGLEAESELRYIGGQNLFVNGSFEAGVYGWNTGGMTATLADSEVSFGKMLVLTSSTGGILQQTLTVPATFVDRPFTISALVKLVGSGYVVGFTPGFGNMNVYRTNANTGWQRLKLTIRPPVNSSGGFGLRWLAATGPGTLYVDELTISVGEDAIVNPAKFGSFELNTATFTTGAAAPTTGTWVVGSRVFNAAPAVGQPKSWVCTVAGTPGTWVSEGNL